MPAVIVSPNMSLPIPQAGIDTGPDYANNLDASLTIIDQHNHSPGSGVQITPNGININADLPINGNNIIGPRSVRFNAQVSPLAGASDLGCLYVSGVDLYYNDGSGNQIRVTQGGSVNGSSGTITGLPSGTAGASFSGGVFSFNAASTTFANINMASAVLSNNTALSKQLTLSPPNAMGANYSVVLPAPNSSGSLAFMTYDTSNNMGTGPAVNGGLTTSNISPTAGIVGTQLANQTITATQIANSTITSTQIAAQGINQDRLQARSTGTTVGAGGVAVSASSGNFNTNSTSGVFVTNLSVTITTTGRPVRVFLVGDGNPSTSSFIGVESADPCSCNIILYNGATILSQNTIQIATGSGSTAVQNFIPVSSLSTLDMTVNGVPGTYTYQILMQVSNAAYTGHVLYAQLVAYEI